LREPKRPKRSNKSVSKPTNLQREKGNPSKVRDMKGNGDKEKGEMCGTNFAIYNLLIILFLIIARFWIDDIVWLFREFCQLIRKVVW
jgi:hypothetical protein